MQYFLAIVIQIQNNLICPRRAILINEDWKIECCSRRGGFCNGCYIYIVLRQAGIQQDLKEHRLEPVIQYKDTAAVFLCFFHILYVQPHEWLIILDILSNWELCHIVTNAAQYGSLWRRREICHNKETRRSIMCTVTHTHNSSLIKFPAAVWVSQPTRRHKGKELGGEEEAEESLINRRRERRDWERNQGSRERYIW